MSYVETPRNYEQKCPVVLLLDTSGSMSSEGRIDELNKALNVFKDEILKDEVCSTRLEVAVITFDDEAALKRDFDLLLPEQEMPVLSPGGTTNLVDGMTLSMQKLEERKAWYKSNGLQYYRPYIVLFTDGAPTNTAEEIEDLDRRIQENFDAKKFVFLPFGVGEADMQMLAKLAAQTQDQRLKDVAVAFKLKDVKKFADVFKFVSASLSNGIKAAETGKNKVVQQLDPTIAQAVTFQMT